MATYRYEAVDSGGRRRRGVVEADTARKARREVAATGLTLTALTEGASRSTRARGPRPPKPKDVVATTRQLGTLIEAGMPVEEALGAVATQEDGSAVAGTLSAVRTRVIEGWRLADALAEHPKAFSPLYVGIVSAGEASSTLGTVLGRLADMMERNRAIMSKAVSSMIYPLVIVVVALIVVWAMMRWVVPKMVEQYADMGVDLPLLTRMVIGASDAARWLGPLLAVSVVGGIAALIYLRRRPGPRRRIDRAFLRLPLAGALVRELDAARFARTLATLFASGTPLLDALGGARRTVVNAHIREELGQTQTWVREGASLSNALRRAGVFPPMMASMVSAGERAGQLPQMLEKTADQMEAGFEQATTLALRLLEPAVIVILGAVVLVILLAIMMPILQLNTLAIGG